MTISELIEKLEDAMAETGDIEVQMVYQQNYPLCTEIKGLSFGPDDGDGILTVFVVAGQSAGYGSTACWDSCF